MIRAAVITVSDSAAAGKREDLSGPALIEKLNDLGWQVVATRVVADEFWTIGDLLVKLSRDPTLHLAVTTGGTGLSLRDRTPEATREVAEREVPGFGELMRAEGRKSTKFADLSRSSAFTLKSLLILNLPGSPKAALDSLLAVADLIPHAVDLLQGNTEHKAETKV